MRTLIMLAIILLVAVNEVSAQVFREEPGQGAEVLKAQTAIQSMAEPADQLKNPATISAQGTMSDKEKADVFLSLTRLAFERYDRTTDTNWRVRFATWAAFGAATTFVLASEKWRPRRLECILASLIAIGFVVTVNFIWGPHQYDRVTRWSRVALYWESAVEDTVKARLPDYLHPTSEGMGGWVRYKGGLIPDKPRLPWYKSRVYLSSCVITVLFGLLFIGAIVARTDWRGGLKNKKPSRKEASQVK